MKTRTPQFHTEGWLLICIVLLLTACGAEQTQVESEPRPVRAMKVGDIAGFSGRTFPGRAMATQEVDLSFRVNGPLISLPIKVGDVVSEGDVVARIDPRDYEVQLRNIEGQLERAKANRTRAQGDYDRVLNIQKEDVGAVSEAAVDRTREALELAIADIAALEASVDSAKDALAYTFLKAPFDGKIVATYVENFETVQPRERILRMLDNDRIEFVFNLSETLISLTPLIRDIEVRFDAFADVGISAEIHEVGSEASQTTRTYPITLIMDQPEGVEILPGMAGKVSGTVRPADGMDSTDVIVPVTAVFADAGDKSYVWVIDAGENTVKRREISVDKLVSNGIVVQSGLEPGELIATAGVHFLVEGQPVRPQLQ